MRHSSFSHLIMAMLASKDFQKQKQLPPAGLDLIISLDQDSNAYPTELAWYVLVRGSLN